MDGSIGPGSKYLNLNVANTALIFSGTTARVPGRMELWVAEDAVERDPTSYTLYGTNAAIPALTSGGTCPEQLHSDRLRHARPARTRAEHHGGRLRLQPERAHPGSTAYASYLLVFPTVKNTPTAANSMQISEVQLYADGLNVVESSDFSNTGSGPSFPGARHQPVFRHAPHPFGWTGPFQRHRPLWHPPRERRGTECVQ